MYDKIHQMGINKCENCLNSCCIDFKLAQELIDPKGLQEKLNNYPFIHRTSSEIVHFHGCEIVVGVYNCDRFNKNSRTCINYDTKERPQFCKNTGITSTPNDQCLLAK